MTTAQDVICEKKMREKDVVGIVTFDLIGLLPTIAYNYYNDIPEFVRKRLVLTVKQLKQRNAKYLETFHLSESRFFKKWQTTAIIQEISDSNLETGINS